MSARVLDASSAEHRAEAAALLANGRLVALPTETVYGLGADATSPEAVARVFRAKQRPSFDPLIVHVADVDALGELVLAAAPTRHLVSELASRFWPGPLTLVLPRTARVPDLVTSGLDTVAVRVPAHEATREVIARAGCPVAAPSANRFGSLSPTTAHAVLDQLGDRIDAVLDGGPCEVGVESTIVSLVHATPRLLRLGGTPVEALRSVLPDLEERLTLGDGPEGTEAPEAPGQLSRHYAPGTPLRLCETPSPDASAALLVPMGPAPATSAGYGRVVELSPSGDDVEAARRLFAALRDLDRASVARIDVLPCPTAGLGRAIHDRLRRASVR